MTRLRRAAPLVGVVIFLALAAGFSLLAVDVHAWQRTLRRDDVRFTVSHKEPGLWRSPALLPGDPAEHLLGLGSPLAYRRAVQLFWISQVGGSPASRRTLSPLRVTAGNDLQALVNNAKSPAERSRAANLLGVMTITTPNASKDQTFRLAEAYFQEAITTDPSDYAARANLELLLRLERPLKTKAGSEAQGGTGSGGSSGAGIFGGGF
jgi:hypothetical protein